MARCRGFFAGWKGLGRFWAITVGLLVALATGLQIAGPPAGQPRLVAAAPSAAAPPALRQPVARSDRPSVALLVGGIGMSLSDSTAAIESLPPAVTLAVAPYGASTSRLLPRIQAAGHEYLLSLPMEPSSFPVDDPDAATALMASLTEAETADRLRTILSRAPGSVGLTNVLGPLLGDRLMAAPDLFGVVRREARARGLFFLEAGTQPLDMHGRQADLVLDSGTLTGAILRQRLDHLTHIALDKGSAVGIITVPRPVTLRTVADWTRSLHAQGVDLVPVSALVSN